MPRQISVVVDDEIDRIIRLYMEASGNKLAVVVRSALKAYVLQQRLANAGVDETYEQLEAEYFASAKVPSLVARRKPKKKTIPSDEPGAQAQNHK